VASLQLPLARIRRPATGRLNSGVRRQKNIRFQPHFSCPAAPLTFAPLPSLAAAPIPFGSHAILRIVRLARSRFASVAFARFGNSDWCGLCSATDTVASETPGCEFLGCASGPSRFVFRQVRQGLTCIGVHRHLTIRSSRPHVVAPAACFALRLHASAAPPRVGLTQALGAKDNWRVAPKKCMQGRLSIWY
jgi:hypothetical protein